MAIAGQSVAPLTYHCETPLSVGAEVSVRVVGRERRGFVVQTVNEPSFKTLEALPTGGVLPKAYWQTARFLAEYYRAPFGLVLDLFMAFTKVAQAPLPFVSSPLLSELQRGALRALAKEPVGLLFGDTGSGKTEIYAAAIGDVLAMGKSAILLMPEIGLTPQTQRRLEHYFGAAVAVWHSRQTKATKRKILERIASGEVRVVAGARSALFLPLPEVGLIVVDEEHDDSYKSSSKPYYHARDAALVLADKLGARVILGSATPSLTSWARFSVVRLRGGYHAGSRRYEVVAPTEKISPPVAEAIKETLEAGRQVLFFVPTRANFKYLVCGECGAFVECPFCSVGMSLHHRGNFMACHYCNYKAAIPAACPVCGSNHLQAQRAGTAQITHELTELFPAVRIARFDRDEITTDAKLRATLEAFRKGETDILVGTQMVSKGHDYPGIGLAVVWGIDHLFALPDYRARERAVAMIVQIVGRVGRAGEGRVLLSSAHPKTVTPYLSDYELFLREEIEYRRPLYPPHVRLARILYRHKDQSKAVAAMDRGVAVLKKIDGIDIIGWGEAPIERMGGEWRYVILLRSSSASLLLGAVAALDEGDIDIDPVSFS